MIEGDRVRHEGGGRKNLITNDERVSAIFLEVIEPHIAGDPMNENIRWIKLTRAEISLEMEKRGFKVSRNIVRKLLKSHKFVKRKIQRKKAIGKCSYRDEQFKIINDLRNKFMKSDNPIISIDTKKKENIGNLHRNGEVYCTTAIESYDHDYPYLATDKIVPHGIYDVKQNIAHVNIGVNNETAEFICDSVKHWWKTKGNSAYPNASQILILCDSGGANSYRHKIFKFELTKLANSIGIKLVLAHYPPYSSKWNPIEHRVFPHVTRAMSGVILDKVETAKILIKTAKTKTGLKVTANVLKKMYEKGKKITHDMLDVGRIKFYTSVENLNYIISPAVT